MKKKERKNAGRKRAVTALKHSKRMLSVLLIFMMLITMMPASSMTYADEQPPASSAPVQNNDPEPTEEENASTQESISTEPSASTEESVSTPESPQTQESASTQESVSTPESPQTQESTPAQDSVSVTETGESSSVPDKETGTQATVTAAAFYGEQSLTVHWADNGNEAGERPDPKTYPVPALSFSVDGAEPAELTADNLGEVGLSDMPEITVSGSGDSYTITVPGDTLPSSVKDSRSGDEITRPVEWDMDLKEIGNYSLTEIKDPENYWYAAAGAGWYYVLDGLEKPYEAGWEVLSFEEADSSPVYWADDANRAQLRPTTEEYPALELYFARTSADKEDWEPAQEEYRKLEEGTLKEAFLESMPSIEVTAADENSFTVTTPGETLPSSVKETGENGEETTWILKWKIVLPQVEHYRLTEVTEEQAGKGEYAFAENGAGWYYVLEEGGREESRVLAWEEASRQKVYWADGGDASGIRPEPEEFGQPVLRFAVTVQGGEGTDFVELTADNLEEVCLEKTPVIEVTQEGDSFVLSHDGETFPSEILFAKADGTEEVRTVEWEMLLPEVEGYTLTEVTESEMEAGAYSWADQGAGWYYVLDSEEGVRIDGYSDNLEVQVFWVEEKDSEGGMSPGSEDYPEPELTFFVEEGTAPDEEPADGEDESAVTAEGSGEETLTEDNMEQLGLSGLPEVQINREQQAVRRMSRMAAGAAGGREDEPSYSVERYRIRVDGESLPSCVTKTEAGGEETSFFVSWTMKLQEVEGYRLMEVTEEMINANPELYFFAAGNGAGMYYVSNDLKTKEIKTWMKEQTISIHWLDNNQEAGRPGEFPYKIEFAVSDTPFSEGDPAKEWTELTETNRETVGLEQLPQPAINEETGIGEWTFSIPANTLPTEIQWTDPMDQISTQYIQWRITPQKVDGYELTDSYNLSVDAQDPPDKDTGWYYVRLTDFTFRLQIGWGDLGNSKDSDDMALVAAIKNAVMEYFHFTADYEGGKLGKIDATLETIKEKLVLKQVDDTTNQWDITLKDLPMYYYTGGAVSYTVNAGEKEPGTASMDVTGLAQGDSFSFRFDNTGSATVGNLTDHVYNGGTLVLTLEGKKNYKATKEWLDKDRPEGVDRPSGEFELWRYRKGYSYTSASPVYGTDGKIITVTLDTQNDQQTLEFDELDKYDSEGYEYLYVVREYLNGGSYEQVYGEVNDDGSVSDLMTSGGEMVEVNRQDGDDFLYNGGTLSNRLKETSELTVIKEWNASAFQTDFGDVKVELRLQSRPAGSEDEGAWTNMGDAYQVTMDEFYAEQLTDSETVYPPRYGAHGEELEYRWVESAVYQGDSENLLKNGEFTLNQNGEKITYRSSAEESESEPGVTVVTNSIADTVVYEVVKEWHDENGNPVDPAPTKEIEFGLYRAISGEQPDYNKPLYTFVMDGVADPAETKLTSKIAGEDTDDTISVTVQEKEAWKAAVEGLPEYDENGMLYQYFLLEVKGVDGYFPTYETVKIEDGGYRTTVYNAPGDGNYIIVQKYWTDDSDIMHRENVTLEVRSRNNGELITTVTLENGVWDQWVSIGDYEPEEVYLVETMMRTEYAEDVVESDVFSVSSPDNSNWKEIPTVDEDGKGKEVHGIHALYHSYEITYQMERLQDVGQSYLYSVTNRRLGNVNITVTKEWIDGGGKQREALQQALAKYQDQEAPRLVLYLDFALTSPDFYEMTHSPTGSDSVKVANEDVYFTNNSPEEETPVLDGKTVLNIECDQEKSTYYFTRLPKYDLHGEVARYEVKEMWVDQDNQEIDAATLKEDYPEVYEAYHPYSTTITSEYVAGTDDEKHLNDTQTVTVVNRLSGTKDVEWHKKWNDHYTSTEGRRPDIYLDLYRLVHVKDTQAPGGVTTKLESVMKNYRWRQEDDTANTDFDWSASFTALPRYDSLGYEIFYYAVEHTAVDTGLLEYVDVGYSMDNVPLGTMYAPNETALGEEQAYVQKLPEEDAAGGKQEYALKEEGTFTNTLEGSVSAVIQKRWENLPSGYAANGEDLPEATFYLYRGTDNTVDTSESAKPVAWLTVSREDWKKILHEGNYTFEFVYEGSNELTETGQTEPGTGTTEAKLLSKYDPAGKLYDYVLTEEIKQTAVGPAMTAVYDDPVITGYTAANIYNSQKGSLAFKKILKLPMKDDDTPAAYPAVEFEISRTYKKNDGSVSKKEVVGVAKAESFAQTGTIVWKKAAAGTGENLIWTGEEVQAAYEESKSAYVEAEFRVDGLDRYAPNGEEYLYRIEEIKTNLNDYQTWVEDGEKEIRDATSVMQKAAVQTPKKDSISLTPYTEDGDAAKPADSVAVSATFFNAQDKDRDEQILEGLKIWDDLDDVFQWRPQMPGPTATGDNIFTVTISRHTAPQPGGSAMTEEVLTEETDYQITWETVTGKDNQWKYTVTGLNGDKLERYAPNGMEWQYTVKEKLPEHYTCTPQNRTATEKGDPKENNARVLVQNMTDLTNSITTQVKFNKIWVDGDGQEIAQDYLGASFAVVFELQVKEENGNSYQSAKEYFESNEKLLEKIAASNSGDGFDRDSLRWKLTGKLTDPIWKTGAAFKGLPAEIGKGSNTVKLSYRVVERAILFGNNGGTDNITVEEKQTDGYSYKFDTSISSLFSPYYQDGTQNRNVPEGGVHNQYNQLKTSEITVTKKWDKDAGNIYGTRPEAEDGSGYDWKTSFLIQRKMQGSANWENVLIGGDENAPLIVDLYGKNEDSQIPRTIEGLPESGIDENGSVVSYQYRALELNDGTDAGSAIQNPPKTDDKYNQSYSVTYDQDGRTVTNTLEETKIYAKKVWIGNDPAASLTLELQYQKADESWSSFPTPAKITLNGTEVTGTAAYRETTTPEEKAKGIWTAVWEHVPKVYPGSKTEEGKTLYRVVETIPSGYQALENVTNGTKVENDVTYPVFQFENMRQVSLTVTKKWYGEENPEEIVVELYRKAGNDGTEEPVKDKNGDSLTRTLTATNQWKATFDGLPKYVEVNGQWVQCIYYAKEVSIGGTSAEGTDYRILYKNTPETLANKPNAFQTAITNIGRMDIEGTKTWNDNGDQYGTRPDELELKLYRSTKETPDPEKPEDWTEVTGETLTQEKAAFQWKSINGDEWDYQYTGLLSASDEGKLYTYRVEEILPQIKGTANPDIVEANDRYEQGKGTGAYDFTNTLTGKTEVTVTKTWADGGNADGFRREITLELYADGTLKETVTLDRTGVVSQILNTFTDSGDQWSYTFENLDKYDTTGKLIEYTVKETKAPDGYEQGTMEGDAQDGFEITNTLLTSVTVEKVWHGIRPDREHRATIGLYRKTRGTQGQPEPVTDQTGNPLTVTMTLPANSTGNRWSYTFNDLPRFDPDGIRYEYSVQELAIEVGGQPADSDFVIHTEGGMVADGTNKGAWSYTITNIGGTEISGTKTWKDNSNAYNTRPENLELTLWRKTNGGTEEEVKEEWLEADGSELIWTKQGDVWTYTYKGLPLTDDQGAIYTYRVQETVPAGYVSDPADGFAGEVENYSFTNTLTDWVNIPVVKIWEDNKDSSGKRPDSIEVILYANGKEYRRVTVGKDTNVLAHIWNRITGGTDDEWKFEFTNLPKYDADGALITYSIEEKVPEGYDGYYEAEDGLMKIVNLREGSLRVTKKVSGSAGDKGRRFHFTVKLEDTSINGTYGDMEFENGVAKIKLRHGESATASGLPAGIGYRVSEEDVSENGYTTWAENASGEIVLDGTVNVIFHNHRNLPEEDDEEEDPVVPVQPVKPAPPAGMPALPGMVIPETSAAPASAQTGDFANPALYAGLAVLASGTIAGILIGRKRRTKKNKKKRA